MERKSPRMRREEAGVKSSPYSGCMVCLKNHGGRLQIAAGFSSGLGRKEEKETVVSSVLFQPGGLIAHCQR